MNLKAKRSYDRALSRAAVGVALWEDTLAACRHLERSHKDFMAVAAAKG